VSGSVIDSISRLAADVRSESPDCYLATLFAPAEKRRSLIALYAFDNELARIPRIVSEPMAGLVRLQWWDDMIDGLQRGRSVGHPVVAELMHAVTIDGLDAQDLKRLIDGRRQPFEADQPPSLLSFHSYLVDIGGSMTSAAAKLLNIEDKVTLAAAERAGVAKAAQEQLNFLGRTFTNRELWLPAAWLDLRAGERFSDASDDFVITGSLAELGLAELKKARAKAVSIKRHQLSAFFPATLAGMQLRRSLRSTRKNGNSNRALVLMLAWLRGRF
jgi:phytoene synthase